MRETEGSEQDLRREPGSILETPESASGRPAAVLVQTLLGLPEVLGALGEPGKETPAMLGGE